MAVLTGAPVPVAVPDALGLAVAVAETDGVDMAEALAKMAPIGGAEVVNSDARVGVAVGAAWLDAAGVGSNPPSSPANSRTGTTIRLINGRMHVSSVRWITN